MEQQLDILLAESHRGFAASTELALTAAGHRVHRCFPLDGHGFPCVGMADPRACPDDGTLDVAVVARRGVLPHPTPLEHGVSCAIRAGMLLVESGTDILDPFAPWVDARVEDDDVVGACEAALLADEIGSDAVDRLVPLLDQAGIAPSHVRCRVRRQHGRIVVHLLSSSPLPRRLEQSLAVRALDAIRDRLGSSHRVIDVQVHQLLTP